ncbi:hypothetical protein C2S52_000403 [Perilla frutescens var. hirtella]|nr:hypothetical protein C2S52_000403 [Perilla frutescens var. hirtella]
MATFVEGRLLKITIISAEILPQIWSSGKMKAYAEVWIDGRPSTATKTDTDMVRELNPRWDFVAEFNVMEADVRLPGGNLAVKIWSKSSLGQDIFVGDVRIPIKSLFDMGLHSQELVRYDVENTTSNWVLYISYSFGPRIKIAFPSLSPSHEVTRGHGYSSSHGHDSGYGCGWGPLPAGPITAKPRLWGARKILSTVVSTIQLASTVTSLVSNCDNLLHHHHHDNVGQSSHHVYDQYNHSFNDSYNYNFDHWPN